MVNLAIEPFVKSIDLELQYNKERVSISCPVCQKTDWEILDHIRKPMSDSHMCICKNCGFISYNPQLKDIAEFYVRDAKQQSLEFLQTKSTKLEKHKKLIFKYLEDNKIVPKRCVDLGCSDGYTLSAIKKLYPEAEVIGVEPNPGHRNWAKYVEEIPCEISIDKIEGKFDLVILYHVLEHLQKPDEQLNWIYEHLTDDGLLYLALPTISRCDYPNIETLFKPDHINVFTNETLIYFLNKMGFEEVFFDNILYGTCLILKKNEEFKNLVPKTFYKENMELLNRLKICFDNKAQMEMTMKKGGITQARTFAEKALQAFDEFPELICKTASLNDVIDEVDMLKSFIEKKPHMYELRQQLAMCSFKEKEFESAKEQFLKIEEVAGASGITLTHLAYIAYHQQNILEAIGYMKRAVKYEPFNANNINLLGAFVMQL